MQIHDIIGIIAATLTTVSFVPQVVKVVQTRHTKDISLGMYIIFVFGVSAWLIYGGMINSLAIIVGNAVTLGLALIILLYKLREK